MHMQMGLPQGMQNQQLVYQGGMGQQQPVNNIMNMNINQQQPANNYGSNPMMVTQPAAPQFVVAQPVQMVNPPPAPQFVVNQPVQMVNPTPASPKVVMARPRTRPGRITCPHCQTEIVTETKFAYGSLTWILVATLGVCMLWPFCLIPLCCKQCEDVKHYCPSCMRQTHVHKRL